MYIRTYHFAEINKLFVCVWIDKVLFIVQGTIFSILG